MKIEKGKKKTAVKVVIYGPEGIGKSTLASKFPDPLFIDVEGGTYQLDVARFERPETWDMINEQICWVLTEKTPPCRTLVIDTADKAEKLCSLKVCANAKNGGIEDFGYGKGYTYLAEEFGKFLNLLTDVVDHGINVVVLAHSFLRKFEQPDEIGAYDRYELKLERKTAPMLKEWADALLFLNYKTEVIVDKDSKGNQKGKNKAQGGRRVVYTTHHPAWDAKNRFGMPDMVDLDYNTIASYLFDYEVEPEPAVQKIENPKKQSPVHEPEPDELGDPEFTEIPADDGIPNALKQLMDNAGVTEEDIVKAVATKGYYPETHPESGKPMHIYEYGNEFVNGMLIGKWNGFIKFVNKVKGENK